MSLRTSHTLNPRDRPVTRGDATVANVEGLIFKFPVSSTRDPLRPPDNEPVNVNVARGHAHAEFRTTNDLEPIGAFTDQFEQDVKTLISTFDRSKNSKDSSGGVRGRWSRTKLRAKRRWGGSSSHNLPSNLVDLMKLFLRTQDAIHKLYDVEQSIYETLKSQVAIGIASTLNSDEWKVGRDSNSTAFYTKDVNNRATTFNEDGVQLLSGTPSQVKVKAPGLRAVPFTPPSNGGPLGSPPVPTPLPDSVSLTTPSPLEPPTTPHQSESESESESESDEMFQKVRSVYKIMQQDPTKTLAVLTKKQLRDQFCNTVTVKVPTDLSGLKSACGGSRGGGIIPELQTAELPNIKSQSRSDRKNTNTKRDDTPKRIRAKSMKSEPPKNSLQQAIVLSRSSLNHQRKNQDCSDGLGSYVDGKFVGCIAKGACAGKVIDNRCSQSSTTPKRTKQPMPGMSVDMVKQVCVNTGGTWIPKGSTGNCDNGP